MLKLTKHLLRLIALLVTAAWIALLVYNRYYVDKTAPVLTMDSDTVAVSVSDGESALLRGVTATDNKDGDITDRVMVRSKSALVSGNSAVVSYAVFDAAGNMSTASRTVVYEDYVSPRFALSDALVYRTGSTVSLMDRLSAEDVIDGDISGSIRLLSSTVSSSTPGIYSIVVSVTNSLGDTTILPLSVVMQSYTIQQPVLQLDTYLVYLPTGGRFDPSTYFAGKAENSAEKNRTLADDPEGDGLEHSMEGVEIDSNVDTSTAGVYECLYSWTNEAEVTSTVVLTVVVTD